MSQYVPVRPSTSHVCPSHCDLKVSRSQAKINESFANYFVKIKANNKLFIVLISTCKEQQKSISVLEW